MAPNEDTARLQPKWRKEWEAPGEGGAGGGEEAPHTKVVRGGSPKGKTRAQILPVAPVAPNI